MDGDGDDDGVVAQVSQYSNASDDDGCTKKKPSHPCPFCDKMLPRLSRHLLTVHKNSNEITRLAGLPVKARDVELKKLR